MAVNVEGATAAEFTLRRFGRPVAIVERFVNVGGAVQEILPNNPRRLFWVLNNRGETDLAIAFTREFSFSQGFLVASGGGMASMDVMEDGEGVAWSVYAVSGGANTGVRILEVIAR